jgi:DNA polymerase III alpha subunit
MRLDQFSNPIFSEQDIFEALYKGQTLSPEMFVESNNSIKKLEEVSELKFWAPLEDYNISLEEYDSSLQTDWYMPDEYKNLDIEEFLVSVCPENNYQRLVDELSEYKSRNMVDLLRWLKYFVDTCEKNNIVWGIGRGSSVASYALYLIGVHSVDSVKYNLDWQEFLR